MAHLEGENSKPLFAPLLDRRQTWEREMYLRFFRTIPKQGHPNKLPPPLNPGGPQSLKVAYTSQDLKIRSKLRDVVFNATGSRLYCAARDGVVVVTPSTLGVECTLTCKVYQALPHPWHPDIFAALCQEAYGKPSSVKIFDLRLPSHKVAHEKNCVEIISPYKEAFFAGCWRPDAEVIVITDRVDRVLVLPVPKSISNPCSKNSIQHQMNTHSEPPIAFDQSMSIIKSNTIYGANFDAFGDLLFLYRADGYVDVYPGSPLKLDITPYQKKAHSNVVTACAVDRLGYYMATGGTDHMINLFDLNTMTSVGVFPKLDGQISGCTFSYDSKFIAWGTRDSLYTTSVDDKDEAMSGSSGNHFSNTSASISTGTSTSHSRHGSSNSPYSLSIASTSTCEVYFRHMTASPVISTSFHPSRYLLAFGCDAEGSGNQSHLASGTSSFNYRTSSQSTSHHPIGILTME